MLANKTGTIVKGCASRPQIRNMIANEATRRKRKASNLIDLIVYRAGWLELGPMGLRNEGRY